MNNLDKNLKAVVILLREMAANGTMERGQKESISKAIIALRRAVRTTNPVKIKAAAGRVAAIFLRAYR